MQNEVTKLVRSEILQFTTKTARATSSPIENHVFPTTRRVLTYESPSQNCEDGDDKLGIDPHINSELSHVFKIPKPLTRKRKSVENKIVSLPKRRRSERLKNANNINDSFDCDRKPLSNICSPQNVSVKHEKAESAQMEMNTHNSVFKVPLLSPSRKQNERTAKSFFKTRSSLQLRQRKDIEQQSCGFCDCSKSTSNATSRRSSVRLEVKKSQATDYNQGQMKRPTKSNAVTQGQKTNTDSPVTAHTKQVLNILNHGNRHEIEKLHSVGTKTADRILFFRQIKGSFKKISDLAEMPEWREKRYQRFLSQNFLREDV